MNEIVKNTEERTQKEYTEERLRLVERYSTGAEHLIQNLVHDVAPQVQEFFVYCPITMYAIWSQLAYCGAIFVEIVGRERRLLSGSSSYFCRMPTWWFNELSMSLAGILQKIIGMLFDLLRSFETAKERECNDLYNLRDVTSLDCKYTSTNDVDVLGPRIVVLLSLVEKEAKNIGSLFVETFESLIENMNQSMNLAGIGRMPITDGVFYSQVWEQLNREDRSIFLSNTRERLERIKSCLGSQPERDNCSPYSILCMDIVNICEFSGDVFGFFDDGIVQYNSPTT